MRDYKNIEFKSEFVPGTKEIFPPCPENILSDKGTELDIAMIRAIAEYVLTFDMEGEFDA